MEIQVWVKEQFNINFREHFSKEIKYLNDFAKDGLVEISDNSILLNEIGRDFVQNIMNVFDRYDPPRKSYQDRLATAKKAKESQAAVQEQI